MSTIYTFDIFDKFEEGLTSCLYKTKRICISSQWSWLRKSGNKFNFQLQHLTQARGALISVDISLDLQFMHFFTIYISQLILRKSL